MIHYLAILILVPVLLLQEAEANAFSLPYASIDTIRGKVVAIDTKTGFLVDGYTIEVDGDIDPKALAKIRISLISDTRHEYRKFEHPKRSQFLLLVRKTQKPQVSVGDRVEIRGYSIVGDGRPKDGEPQFKTFAKIAPEKKNG